MYPTTILVRAFFCICFVVFYLMSKNPLFLVMLGIVGLGLFLTTSCYVVERAKKYIKTLT